MSQPAQLARWPVAAAAAVIFGLAVGNCVYPAAGWLAAQLFFLGFQFAWVLARRASP